jgi:hypothetical protein
MVKQTLNRYPGLGKDRLASENFRISRNEFLHKATLAPAANPSRAKATAFHGSNNLGSEEVHASFTSQAVRATISLNGNKRDQAPNLFVCHKHALKRISLEVPVGR